VLQFGIISTSEFPYVRTNYATDAIKAVGMYRISSSAGHLFESGSGQNVTRYRISQPDSARFFWQLVHP